MEAIKFEITQSLGVISTNFDSVKKYIEEETGKYEGLVVTEESRTADKKTVADLRKLKKNIDDSRKEAKKVCMKPYEEFEELRIKPLLSMTDKAINHINKQVEEFEQRRLEERRKEIQRIYDEEIVDMADILPLWKIRNEKWENAGTTAKSIRAEIADIVERGSSDIAVIQAMTSDAVPEALNLYKSKLNLADAIKHINQYEAQKAEILKREEEQKRAREEADRRAEIERIRMEERRRVAEEAQIREEAKAETMEKIKTVDEESAALLTAPESHRAVYTVVGTEEELRDLETAMTSLGLYFERKDA